MSTHLVPDKHIKVPIRGPPPQSVYSNRKGSTVLWLTVTLDNELLSQLPLSRGQAFQGCLCTVLEFPLGSHKTPFPYHTFWFETGNSVDTGCPMSLHLIQIGENIPDLSPECNKGHTNCGCRAEPYLGHGPFHSKVFSSLAP